MKTNLRPARKYSNIIYVHTLLYMKNLIHHFPTCYAYSVKKPIGELSLERALDEDTGVFSLFLSSLSSSPLGQTAVSGNSTFISNPGSLCFSLSLS